jgi:hypothetical protein
MESHRCANGHVEEVQRVHLGQVKAQRSCLYNHAGHPRTANPAECKVEAHEDRQLREWQQGAGQRINAFPLVDPSRLRDKCGLHDNTVYLYNIYLYLSID